jgi:putative NADPH-quinone reductase
MNVLVIIGHPRKQSLSATLGESYIKGAKDGGVDVKSIYIADLQFNPNVIHPTPHLQEDEPDIKTARELFFWADHICFVYPTWWEPCRRY